MSECIWPWIRWQAVEGMKTVFDVKQR
jgi:hypothetical protein